MNRNESKTDDAVASMQDQNLREGHQMWQLPPSCQSAASGVVSGNVAETHRYVWNSRRWLSAAVVATTAAAWLVIMSWSKLDQPEPTLQSSVVQRVPVEHSTQDEAVFDYHIPESVLGVEGHFAVGMRSPHPNIEVVRLLPLISDASKTVAAGRPRYIPPTE
ncbi:MAG: hypothetical protein AAGC97_02560 [Planctomycetota bacterium]